MIYLECVKCGHAVKSSVAVIVEGGVAHKEPCPPPPKTEPDQVA